MSGAWQVRLSKQAEQDVVDITRWTVQTFGFQQAAHYAETLLLALDALVEGPNTLGAKPRDELGSGIFTVHIARNGRKGRHFIIFKASKAQTIDILRLLHDSMDLARHLPPATDLH